MVVQGQLVKAERVLFNVEQALRELVTDIQQGKCTWGEVGDRLTLIGDMLDEAELEEKENPILSQVDSAIVALSILVDEINYIADSQPEDEQADPKKHANGDIDWQIDIVDEYVRKLTGKGCAWRVSKSIASRINDAAACAHRLAEFVHDLARARTVGRCSISVGASDEATKLCTAWDRYATSLNEMGFYFMDDYVELKGWVVDNRVYFRVGSAEGHRTEVDLGEGKLRYYDYDDHVNRVMKKLFEWAGGRCEVLDDGVKCSIKGADLDKLAYALALATSMDMRMSGYLAPDELKRALDEVLESRFGKEMKAVGEVIEWAKSRWGLE